MEATHRADRRRPSRRASTRWPPRSPSTTTGSSPPASSATRRTRRARDEIEAIAVTALRGRWGDVHGRTELDHLAAAVVTGDTDPYAAADELLATFAE